MTTPRYLAPPAVIGQRVRDRLVVLGWTQTRLAEELKTSKAQVSLLVNGLAGTRRGISGERLARLAATLGLEYSELVRPPPAAAPRQRRGCTRTRRDNKATFGGAA